MKSKAGRDKANIFLVLEILDAKHVLVVDGKLHPLQRPKKKRIKHLQAYRAQLDDLEAMKKNEEFNDSYIRSVLLPYKVQEEDR